MRKLCLSLSVVALTLAALPSSAATKAKRELGDLKKNESMVVYDRSPNSYIGTVLKTRHFRGYIGTWRNDPTVVSFAGTEAVKLGNQFSIETVLHSKDTGKYNWKEGKATSSPIRMIEEHALINRGDQWGLSIKENTIIFYANLDGKKQQVEYAVPANWNRPITTHRLSGVYNGSKMTLFYDGKLVASKKASGKISNIPQAIYAGARPETPNKEAKLVQIDEVRIYNRALSATEINNTLRRKETAVILSSDIIQTEKVVFEQ